MPELLMDWDDILAQQIYLPPPHLIPQLEDPEEPARLGPLDDRLMLQLPPLNDTELIGLLDLSNPLVPTLHHLEVAVRPAESPQAYLHAPDDSRPWGEYEEMNYEGVAEENDHEWYRQQLVVEDVEPESNEIIREDTVEACPEDGRIVVSLATKRSDNPTSDEDNVVMSLLQEITSAAPHIATMSLLEEAAMSHAAAPVFGPGLEPVPVHQQQPAGGSRLYDVKNMNLGESSVTKFRLEI